MSKRRVIALTAVGILLIWLMVAKRHELIRFGLEQAVRVATGYSVQIDGQRLGASHGAFLGVHISRGGEPVLDAGRIDLYYSLRDLLPGSAHRFGISAITIDAPELTLVRHPDGAFNVLIPSGAPGGGGPSVVPGHVNLVPLHFTVRIRGGTALLVDTAQFEKNQGLQRARDIAADVVINSAGRTHYVVTGAFEETKDEPFSAIGTVDVVRGYALHHLRAAAVPIRTIGNFIINSPSSHILAGTARDFDARIYSLDVTPEAPISYHIGAKLDVHGGRLYIASLAQPLDGIDGTLQIVDDTFFARNLRATLAGIPVQLAGSIFQFGAPQFRFGLTGSGDLAKLRAALTFAKTQPIHGDVRLSLLIEGPTASPIVVVHGVAPHVSYRGMPLDDVQANVAIGVGAVYIAPLRAIYAGAPLIAHGTLTFPTQPVDTNSPQSGLQTNLAVHIQASSDRLPYIDELIGGEPVTGDVLLKGSNKALSMHGVVTSTRNLNRIGAIFGFESNGAITIAPAYVDTGTGTFMAEFHLTQPQRVAAFWAVAQNLTLHAPAAPVFPGAPLPQIPPVSGKLLYAAVLGGGKDIALAGRVEAAGARISGVPFASLIATFSGALSDASINALHADGPWGNFDGLGSFSTQRLIARGSYAGTLQGLEPFLGGLEARGALSGPVALAIDPSRIIVQARGVQFQGADIHGVPVERASGTMAYANGLVHIYNANARIADGGIVAAGNFATTPGTHNRKNQLQIVGVELHGAGLQGIGIPLESGEVAVTGTIDANTVALPGFDGAVSLRNGRAQGYDVNGTSVLALHGDSVQLEHTVAALGSSYAILNGSVGSLATRAPAYALHADVPAADVASTLTALHFPTYESGGVFNGALDISGTTVTPRIAGTIGVPGGSLNGLPFINARAYLEADPAGIRVQNGNVLVGSTQIAFSAAARERVNSFAFSTHAATLSDFDNYFDTGDTLSGTGPLSIAVLAGHRRFVTRGNVNVANLRYRSFPIGTTYAFWQSQKNVVTGNVRIGGTHGILAGSGNIGLAPTQDWTHLIRSSRYNVHATLQKFDLSTWLPAIGYPTVPLFGRVNGTARVVGTFPRVALSGDADLLDGSFGRLPIEKLTASVRTEGSTIQLTGAELEASGISANATGNLRLAHGQPFALTVHASTSDIKQLAARLAKASVDITGNFETTVTLAGTLSKPTFNAAFDADTVNAYGVAMPFMFGSLRLQGDNIELRDAGITFAQEQTVIVPPEQPKKKFLGIPVGTINIRSSPQKVTTQGTATLAGSLPLRLQPFEIARNQPVSFDLDLENLDPGTFETLFGYTTQLGGLINGHIGIVGTIQAPRIYGRMALQGGSYLSDLERTQVANTVATVTFDRTSATLDTFTGNFGSGTVQGKGKITFPQGFGEYGDVNYAIYATAKGAQLDLPAYGSGSIDGALALIRTDNTLAQISGTATATNAVIPFSAFLASPQTGGTPPAIAGLPLNFGFALDVVAGKNVRVKGGGYGAGLDIAATGKAHLGGTLVAPTLDGRFNSAGGTLTYFDRAFRVQSGYVVFDPADGIVPTLHAVAVTNVVNPDPDTARNPTGNVDITIKVDGQLDRPDIAFSSSPSGYSKEQIIALIAPFGGFATKIGFNESPTSTLLNQPSSLSGAAPIPNGLALPNGVVQNVNGSITVSQEAFNVLNAQFTSGLLAPLEGNLGQGFGLENLNFTLGYNGNIGLNLTRGIGPNLNALYATSFGIPEVQSFGLSYTPTDSTAAQLTFFFESGPMQLFQTPYLSTNTNYRAIAGQAITGQNGFAFTLQRLFK